jgi:hypothetical protein
MLDTWSRQDYDLHPKLRALRVPSRILYQRTR